MRLPFTRRTISILLDLFSLEDYDCSYKIATVNLVPDDLLPQRHLWPPTHILASRAVDLESNGTNTNTKHSSYFFGSPHVPCASIG
jgi:hypothetical protein